MSAAVVQAASGSGPTSTHIDAKIQYWSSLLPYVAQAAIAYQNEQKSKHLAASWSARRHKSIAITDEVNKATAQAAVHKGEFDAAIRILAQLTPDAVVFGMAHPPPSVPSVHDKIVALEAKLSQMAEQQASHHRYLKSCDDSVKDVEAKAKSLEDEHDKTTVHLTKAHKQLEGKVSQLESLSRLPPKPTNDVRLPLGTEKRIETVEATLKDTLVKSNDLDQRMKAIVDAQRKAQEQYTNFTTALNGFKATQRELHDTREKVAPLLPLASKTQLLLSNLESPERFRQEFAEVKSRNEALKTRLDLVTDMCKAATKSVEDLRNNEISPLVALKTDITGLLTLNNHVSELAKLPEAIALMNSTLAEFVPVKDCVKELIPIAAQSASILSVVSQQEQTTRTLQQLESDVTTVLRDQVRSEDLITRLKAVEAWKPVVEQQKNVGPEQARLKAVTERHEQTMRTYADAHSRSTHDVETLKAEMRRAREFQDSNKDSIASIGSLSIQITQANTSIRGIRNELSKLKDIEIKTQSIQSEAEQAQRDVKSIMDKVTAMAPLTDRVLGLVSLADRRDILGALPERLSKIEESIADEKAENEQRVGQLETLLGRVQKETKESADSVGHGHQEFKKSLESLTNRVVAERQRAQELERRFSELHKDSELALEARTKLQTSARATKVSVDAAQTRLDALEPLLNHVDALVAVADKQVPLVSLAQSFKQAQAVSGHVENVFVACRGMQLKVDTLQASVECLDKRKDHSTEVESLKSEVGKMGSLVDRIAKVEALAEDLPKQYALLQTVDQVQDKIAKCESECKLLQGKIANSSKGVKTEVFELKTKAEDALKVANETAQSLDQLVSLKTHVPALIDLSGQSEHLLSLGKQCEETRASVTKLLGFHEKSTRRYVEMSDSMEMIRKSIDAVERKVNEAEAGLVTLGQDFKGEKDAWTSKVHTIEAEINRLTPEQHNNAPIGLATPSGSPMSPTHRVPSTPDSRISGLEKLADSAKRELRNIAQNLTRIDGKQKEFKEQVAGINTRLSTLWQTHGGPLSSLVEKVPTLVALAAQEPALLRALENAKVVAGIVRRANELDTNLKDIKSRLPIIDQLDIPAFRRLLDDVSDLKELVPLKRILPHVAQIEALVPLAGQTGALGSIAGQVEVLSPLADQVAALSPVEVLSRLTGQVKSLLPLVQRVERIEPLVFQVEKLLPLPARVSEIQGSIAELQKAVAEPRAQPPQALTAQIPSPTSLPRQPVPLPQPSPRTASSSALLPSPNIASSSSRPSKKRKLEDAIESLEERLDSMRHEVDNVRDDVDNMAWDVAELGKNSVSKRARMECASSHDLAVGETTKSDALQLRQFDDHESEDWKQKINQDVDKLQDLVAQLWRGENGWPEKLEAALERAWANSLCLRTDEDRSTLAAVSRLVNAIREDVEVLTISAQVQGPTTMVLGASAMDKATSEITGRIISEVNLQNARFRRELEEWLGKKLMPVKQMCLAMNSIGQIE
ncbi:RING hydroxylating beta subunit domain-containing protein [Ceratobasidium sp. AG-Ba]|nr:RING hydroxylating beta subunit domain-containing protein [Ceratobasidium sp. AG-Ba]